jgi:hypothetical protein
VAQDDLRVRGAGDALVGGVVLLDARHDLVLVEALVEAGAPLLEIEVGVRAHGPHSGLLEQLGEEDLLLRVDGEERAVALELARVAAAEEAAERLRGERAQRVELGE